MVMISLVSALATPFFSTCFMLLSVQSLAFAPGNGRLSQWMILHQQNGIGTHSQNLLGLGIGHTKNTNRQPFDTSTSLNLFRNKKRDNAELHSTIPSTEAEAEASINDAIQSLEDDENDNDEKKNKDKKKETLRFGHTYSFKSQVYSFPSSTFDFDQLYTYFNRESVQNTLLSGGTNSTITRIPRDDMTDNLITKWKDQAIAVKAETPNPDTDSVVIVTPPGIELITVSVIPTTTIGTKLIEVDDSILDNGTKRQLPEFQATLIEDEPKAIGPKFFVWLFNKIVHGGNPDELDKSPKNDDGSNNSRKETALLKLYVQPVDIEEDGIDDDNINFIFVADSSLFLEFEFPRLLLKFFPMKKEKAEKLCSEAIFKALEKNMLPAMDEFCEEFVKFVR